MDPMNSNSLCPVCGFTLDRPAWNEHGPSDEICPSCGIQFGYDDAAGGDEKQQHEVYREWRQRWIVGGMKWHSVGIPKPTGWNPAQQVRKVLDQS